MMAAIDEAKEKVIRSVELSKSLWKVFRLALEATSIMIAS